MCSILLFLSPKLCFHQSERPTICYPEGHHRSDCKEFPLGAHVGNKLWLRIALHHHYEWIKIGFACQRSGLSPKKTDGVFVSVITGPIRTCFTVSAASPSAKRHSSTRWPVLRAPPLASRRVLGPVYASHSTLMNVIRASVTLDGFQGAEDHDASNPTDMTIRSHEKLEGTRRGTRLGRRQLR